MPSLSLIHPRRPSLHRSISSFSRTALTTATHPHPPPHSCTTSLSPLPSLLLSDPSSNFPQPSSTLHSFLLCISSIFSLHIRHSPIHLSFPLAPPSVLFHIFARPHSPASVVQFYQAPAASGHPVTTGRSPSLRGSSCTFTNHPHPPSCHFSASSNPPRRSITSTRLYLSP